VRTSVAVGRLRARPRPREEAATPWFNLQAAAVPLAVVAVYAIAMAYVESAAVLYLRTIYGGVDPVGPRHPPFDPLPDFVWIEIGREAATMVMLAAVACLAGRSPVARVGAFGVAMGLWDIFYYVFLWLFSGWPGSPMAPDVLFLLPLPWWGPVLAPVLIAVLIVAAGSGAVARELGDRVPRPHRSDVAAIAIGTLICLLAFMSSAIAALPGGIEAAYNARGGPFPWPLFLVGAGLGAYGLLRPLLRSSVEAAPQEQQSQAAPAVSSSLVGRLAVGATLGVLLGFLGLPRLEAPRSITVQEFDASNPPTQTPPAQPTPTLAPTINTILFDAPVTSPITGWTNDPVGTAWFAQDGYHLYAREPGQFVATSIPLGHPVQEVSISAAFHKLGGPPGVIVRDQSPPSERDGRNQAGRYLVFEVGDRGEIGVWQRDETHWIDIVPWQHSEAVHFDRAANSIVVTARGSRVVFDVNGQTVADLNYDGSKLPNSGGVGIFVGGDLNQVSLDRLRIANAI
jgi:hypothetical protein